MSVQSYIAAMPKVELHVHLEGATRPETLLHLAERNHVSLQAADLAGLRTWFTFRSFPHFIDIYKKISECIRTADDIELLTHEFLAGQHAQNIVHTEFTYTPYTHYTQKGLAFEAQIAAINRSRAWAEAELGITSGIIIDIDRAVRADEGLITADWAISGMRDGVIALGLGGPEVGHPPEKHAAAFARAHAAGLTCILHAGETEGAASIWSALSVGGSARIGHGVRCLEDASLVQTLRERQIPLEVCPTSNVCLGVAASLAEHPLRRLMAEGLYVTINSDDPPMFNTTLTDEFLRCADVYEWSADVIDGLTYAAAGAARLSPAEKQALWGRVDSALMALRDVHL